MNVTGCRPRDAAGRELYVGERVWTTCRGRTVVGIVRSVELTRVSVEHELAKVRRGRATHTVVVPGHRTVIAGIV